MSHQCYFEWKNIPHIVYASSSAGVHAYPCIPCCFPILFVASNIKIDHEHEESIAYCFHFFSSCLFVQWTVLPSSLT